MENFQDLVTAFSEGRVTFAYGISPIYFLVLTVAVVAAVWFSYRHTTRPVSRGWKTFLIGLRSSAIVILLFCLLRPVITSQQVTPQETYLGILIDDSQSMSIADLDGGRRREAAVSELLFGNNGLIDSLDELFQVRVFRFDKETQRISGATDLLQTGTASSLDQALQHVDNQLTGLPVGGLVLLSDGADNSAIDPVATASRYGARQIPVFTVGTGRERIPRDIGIVDVVTAKTVLEGSVFNVDVALIQEGYEGRNVKLAIMDGETEVAAENITLGLEGVTRRYELEVTPERRELIVYDLTVELQDDEIISENNQYSFLVDNTEKPPLDILYLEGHPRNEYKFIRRAVEGDDSLRLATYLQTGPEKFYRQGIRSPTELSNGFPSSREELYQYEAIILGDIDEGFFNADQLQMMNDFVAERGGGFLSGGMVDETFLNTPVADILPVTLVEEGFLPQHLRGGIRRGSHPTGETYYPRLTRNGEFSPLLRLASDDAENRRLWQQLPEFQGIYVTGRAKPGATVLLEHPLLQYQNQPLPVIATQRYGSGRSVAIATASTWRWQMMMPSEDQSHEVLWRQMLRWLTSSAPERIDIQFDREYYNVGDVVNVRATILDENYEPDNDATLWIQRTDPQDQATDTPMEWDIEEDGLYRTSFTVETEGVYELLVDVTSAASDAAIDSSEKRTAFVVTPSLREYSAAGLDASLLRRIAETSGGDYFNIDQSGGLRNAIEFTPNAYTQEIQLDLWDNAWLLTLLILLLCADWIMRRMKGLS
ncbi:MAG: hypothetical protein WDZ76_04345 [Pseudohongiellaceae bacterium]